MLEQDNNAIFEVSLKFIVKDHDGNILLLKIPDGEPMAGYYDLAGGRIKDSERTQSLKTIAYIDI